LNVQGAFDAAWWPAFLRELLESKCPKILYNLTKSYFTQRTAALMMNSIRVEKPESSGSPQVSYVGPVLFNLQFNSLLQLKFMARTKVVAYADDLLIAVGRDSTRVEENYGKHG